MLSVARVDAGRIDGVGAVGIVVDVPAAAVGLIPLQLAAAAVVADHAIIRRILVFLRSDDLVVPQRGGLRRLGQGQTAEGTVRAAGVARAGAGGLDRVVVDGLMRDGGGISRRGHGAADGADRAREAAVQQVGATVSVTG